MRFSERIGKRQPKVSIQIHDMDNDLQKSIWNALYDCYFYPMIQFGSNVERSEFYFLFKEIWRDFLKENLDEMPTNTHDITVKFKNKYFQWDYLEVYDLVDFIISINDPFVKTEKFEEEIDFVLKRELSGYRVINSQLSPISNDEEIKTIETTFEKSNQYNLKGVYVHLENALNKFSDKRNPDYRNSIKESISAVESVCQQITGEHKAELGKALHKLNEIMPIHGALKKGFTNLYGYTSDGEGIRHAMLEEPNIDQEDALYMLVSCSAFINYLIAKAAKLDLLN